jgi:S1-C subfamily serine protease
MTRLNLVLAVLVVGAIALVVGPSRADVLVLTDGTQIEATTVIKKSDGYWVRLKDGSTQTIPASRVKEHKVGATLGGAPTPGAGASTPGAGASTPRVVPGTTAGDSFKSTKTRADRADQPIVGVSMWEKWIENNPNSPDLAAAQAELENWKKLQKDEAEKINGKWVGGEEKKKLFEKVDQLIAQANKMLAGDQMMEGVKKLEEALKLYPNSFEANFELGYYYLVKGAVGATGRGNVQYLDRALGLLENAAKIQPNSAACWSNLAIIYNFKKQYEKSVMAAYKAAKIRDDKEIVENLVCSIGHAPSGMQRTNKRVQAVVEDAFLLAGKHNVPREAGRWNYIRPKPEDEDKIVSADGDSDIDEGKPGQAWSGSGFFITDDGYLLTNHHVATGDPKTRIKKNITFRVRFDDGTERNAELIAVDEEADIALMRVKVDEPVPFLRLADDNPNQASKALVLGYPATGSTSHSLQISEGQVKSVNPGDEHEVWFDLNTTHGNSGGPIVDRNCRVVGILTAGRTVYNVTYVLGVGPNQIRKFLEKIGDKAPKNVVWESPGTAEFDGEKLTGQARQSTLLILAIRLDKADVATTSSPTTQPTTGG